MIDLARATMSSLPQQIAADPPTPSNNLARGVPAVARAARLFFTTRMLIFLARNSFRNVYVEEEFMPTMFTSRASLTFCKRFLMSSDTRFLTYLLMAFRAFVDLLRLNYSRRTAVAAGKRVAACLAAAIGDGSFPYAAWIRKAGLIVPLMAIPLTY